MPKRKIRRPMLHHRGRLHQVPIYLGKQFRSFLYMNDWKMLPMAGVIAALVAMVIRKYYFVTMEGTLMSSFALTCVAIWNGCFNSIQVICRERPIIKREHRSGMHITSYIFSNMVYQGVLCLAQTGITLYVCIISGVKFPVEGFMTPWLVLDIGITIFLVTYASDMLSLVVSSIAHTTTAAMTVMPFVLIFQLVFSGSIFTLPAWAEKISTFTISHYGLTAITAQSDYNNQPMKTGWDTLLKLENQKVEGTITLGQIVDLAQNGGGVIEEARDRAITLYNPEWIYHFFNSSTDTTASPEATATVMNAPVDIFDAASMKTADLSNTPLTITLGELLDLALKLPEDDSYRNMSIPFSFKIGDILNMFDREVLKDKIITATTKAMSNSKYERTVDNIIHCWAALSIFCLFFALLSVAFLEFIDKDKR